MTFKVGSLFRSKSRSVSRSIPSSFSSSTSSLEAKETPTSVLPSNIPFRQRKPDDVAEDSSVFSSEIHWNSVEVFKLIDKDGDGKISLEELELVLRRLGCKPPSEQEVDMTVDEADRDGDGCISLEEFRALSSAGGPACQDELREVFDVFDVNRDGQISAEELLGVLSALGDDRCTLDECRRMIGSVDADGDGFVGFEDFARMMLH